MKVEQLGLVVGDALQLQIGDNIDQRYPVKYYGANPHGSVIVSAPRSGQDKIIFVREGMLVTLRFVVKNVASGFTTRVIVTRGQPYPYLHLDIPKDIQTVEVSKDVRVSTDITTTIMNKTHNSPALAGHILNLSCSGARIQSSMKIALESNVLNLTMKLELGEISKLVTMDCVVNYVKTKPDEGLFLYGVDIVVIDDEDMIMLRGYIYQQLLHNLHMI